MKLTLDILATIVGGTMTAAQQSNASSVIAGLDAYGSPAGLILPHRLAQFVPQVAHESGRFVYDHEIWGPTAAQARYDTRTDLGNTAAADGDGYLYRGRTGMEMTGKGNYAAFTAWCRKRFDNAPDFVANPELVDTDPWEGLVPIWYWETRGLNAYADKGDIEMVTRKINGGTNGLDDRLLLYTRTALTFLGYSLGAGVVKTFQSMHDLVVDGIDGPKTRAAMHTALVAMDAEAGVAKPVTVAAEEMPEAPSTDLKVPPGAPDIAAAVAKLKGAIADLHA